MTKTTRHPLERIWVRTDEGALSTLLALIVAVSVHVAIGAAARRLPTPPPAAAASPALDVEIFEPPPPPSTPTPQQQQAFPPAASPQAVTPARAPKPAAAGAVLTAPDDSDAPVRFVTDPNGTQYGSGVVAVGGEGLRGERAPNPQAAPSPIPAQAASAPASSPPAFATPPQLGESNPCRGSFPRSAVADDGSATVSVTLGADGGPTRVDVLAEAPLSQGFGRAAVECLRAKRFNPARDAAGAPVAAKTKVIVRFSR